MGGWQSFFCCFTGTHWRGALAERFPTTWWLLAWTRRSLGVFLSNPSLYLVFVAKFWLDLINRDEQGEEFLKVTQAFAERLANAGREENAEEVQHHKHHHHHHRFYLSPFCRPLVNPSIIFTLALDLSCNIYSYISYIYLMLILYKPGEGGGRK